MSSKARLCEDILIVDYLINDQIIKKADGFSVSSLINGVSSYVSSHIDKDNEVASIASLLVPGVILMMVPGPVGVLLGTFAAMFHINIANILKSVIDQLKPHIETKTITSGHIDSAVQSATQENTKPLSTNDVANILKDSFDQSMQNARFGKMAMIIATSGWFSGKNAAELSKKQGVTQNIVSRVLSLILKVAFASAGMMIVGDAANALLGRPSAMTGTEKGGKPTNSVQSVPEPTSKQKKFPINSSYSQEKKNTDENWIENVENNKSSIEQMLISFAKDVYSGLSGKEETILSSPAFETVVERIVWFNHASENAPMVFIPTYFHSKKQIVDFFIDDVAERTP